MATAENDLWLELLKATLAGAAAQSGKPPEDEKSVKFRVWFAAAMATEALKAIRERDKEV